MQVLLECCYIWMDSSQWENWNHFFCRNVSFLTVNFEMYVKVWSRPICICGILYFKLNGIDASDNIFVIFGGRGFQQTIGKPMGTNCVPLLADLFLYSYEADFIQGLLKCREGKCFNAIAGGEGPRLYALWFTPPLEQLVSGNDMNTEGSING
jgi:hypothetical protein